MSSGDAISLVPKRFLSIFQNSRVMGKLTRLSDTNRAVQQQRNARGLEFEFRMKRDCTIYEEKTMALINCEVTTQLTALLFSHMQKKHDAAQMIVCYFETTQFNSMSVELRLHVYG